MLPSGYLSLTWFVDLYGNSLQTTVIQLCTMLPCMPGESHSIFGIFILVMMINKRLKTYGLLKHSKMGKEDDINIATVMDLLDMYNDTHYMPLLVKVSCPLS